LCKKNAEVYKAAKLDCFHPKYRHNNDKMSWYKFNTVFTCNYTRTMAKGVALCFMKEDKDSATKNNITDRAERATCMISYAYDTDPGEFIPTLRELFTIIRRTDQRTREERSFRTGFESQR